MRFPETPFIFSFVLAALYFTTCVLATIFDIRNHCPHKVWAAAMPGGGRELEQGEAWTFSVSPGTTNGRVWGRTNCQFDASGKGKCESGDCDGLLQCQVGGAAPVNAVEYTLKVNDTDYMDMTVVDGFNIPMQIRSTTGGCAMQINCTADINKECPTELRDPGGCNNACAVFSNEQFCCFQAKGDCEPTAYSMFFKERCPHVYTYPYDYDPTSSFTCNSGTNYEVVFCP